MLQRSIFIVALIGLIFAVGAASAQALDAPVPISPAVQYGTTATYCAPRVPTYMWTPVANAAWYYLWISEFDTGTVWKKQWVQGINQWRPSSDDRLVAGTEYKWWCESLEQRGRLRTMVVTGYIYRRRTEIHEYQR